MLNEQFRPGKDILRSLVEHKTETSHIDPVAAAFAGIEKLDVAILENAEFQSLRNVVDLGRNYGVG